MGKLVAESLAALPKSPHAKRGAARHKAPWAQVEDDYLRFHAGERTIRSIRTALRRTHSSVIHRLKDLGIGVAHRACRTASSLGAEYGYDAGTVERIAAWGGVKQRQAYTMPTHQRTGARHVLFDALEMAEVFAAYEAAPTFMDMKRQLRVDHRVLRRLVDGAGLSGKKEGAKKCGHRRFRAAEVEAVTRLVEEWRRGKAA